MIDSEVQSTSASMLLKIYYDQNNVTQKYDKYAFIG